MLEKLERGCKRLTAYFKFKCLSIGYVALSVQCAVFYLVFHIKNISPLSNQKQAVCSFLEHFQSYKIGLIFFIYFFFRRLHQKLSSNCNVVALSTSWNARKRERAMKMEFVSLFIFMYFVSWDLGCGSRWCFVGPALPAVFNFFQISTSCAGLHLKSLLNIYFFYFISHVVP